MSCSQTGRNGTAREDKEPARLPLNEERPHPTFRRERSALKRGVWPIAGCDEAGRGPLAGPVVAAAVILNPDDVPRGLDDSKQLTAERREVLYERICARAQVAVAMAPPARIDRYISCAPRCGRWHGPCRRCRSSRGLCMLTAATASTAAATARR